MYPRNCTIKIQNYNDPLTGVFKENYFRSQIYPQTTLSISKPFYKINKGTKKNYRT